MAKIKEEQIDNFIYRRRRNLGEVFTPLEASNVSTYDFKSLFKSSHIRFHDEFATQSKNHFLLFTNEASKDLLTCDFDCEIDATFPHGYNGIYSQ